MAPKKITVGDQKWEISSADEFKSVLNVLGIKWICREGRNIIGFESLVDGGTYTLGPLLPKQQQVRVLYYCLFCAFESFVCNGLAEPIISTRHRTTR